LMFKLFLLNGLVSQIALASEAHHQPHFFEGVR